MNSERFSACGLYWRREAQEAQSEEERCVYTIIAEGYERLVQILMHRDLNPGDLTMAPRGFEAFPVSAQRRQQTAGGRRIGRGQG